jgi:hypothetical protein
MGSQWQKKNKAFAARLRLLQAYAIPHPNSAGRIGMVDTDPFRGASFQDGVQAPIPTRKSREAPMSFSNCSCNEDLLVSGDPIRLCPEPLS